MAKRPMIFLPKQRQVDVIRSIQRAQRQSPENVAVFKHSTLAKRIGCSESTVRRTVNELVELGLIVRTHVNRPRGGMLCAYRADTNIIYRKSSFLRRARMQIEQVASNRKCRCKGGSGDQKAAASKHSSKSNYKYKRRRVGSVDKGLLKGFMSVAKAAGVSNNQRGALRAAAYRYGVEEAWNAFILAVSGGYRLPDLSFVTWGILKKQFPKGATT